MNPRIKQVGPFGDVSQKASPVAADRIPLDDSEASFDRKYAELGDIQGSLGYYNESNGESSDNTGNWVQKLRLTFTPSETAYYEIIFSCLLSASDAKIEMQTRVQIDDATTKKLATNPLAELIYPNSWRSRSGHFVVQLDDSAHNIDLDFRTGTAAKTVYIKEAVLTARRIA